MLNELVALERGMAAHGFAPVARHPDLSQLLKGDVVRVRLAVNGAIAELELLEGARRPEIWTLRDGKHNGFPGLKTPRGLIVLDEPALTTHDACWKAARSAAARRAEIERLAVHAILDPQADDWPKPGHRTRIAERLHDLASLADDKTTRAVPAAFERFLKALSLQPCFLHRLFEHLLDRARNGEDGWLTMVRDALVGAIPLAIDVTRDFVRDAGDGRQIAAISQALSGNASQAISNDQVCALSGAGARLLEGNFPQPTLPSLGQTYLFSRNDDIRALARYGQNGPASFPVDADLVGRFSGALASVTQEDRRGKTWRLLPAEAGDGRDLFIAFIASALNEPAADSLVTETDDDEEDTTVAPAVLRSQAEHASSRLVKFWQGVATKAKPGARAQLLILRVVDPGNRKAVYSRSPSVDALHRAAQYWTLAMGNIPDGIEFIRFKDSVQFTGRPKVQPPLSLISLSKKLYVRGGREAAEVRGLSGAQVLALFLGEGDYKLQARSVLRLLLDRQGGLICGLAHAKRRGDLKGFDPKTTGRADALRAIAWIGALLFLSDRKKETYMEDAGFKLGQLLAAVDAVHMGYCEVVRNKSIPATLIGNSVFAAAGRNPDRALEVLQTRWKPYHAWATRVAQDHRTKPEQAEPNPAISRAISQLHLAKKLSEELHPVLASMRREGRAPDETFRAELLLGYLAGVKSEKKSKSNPTQQNGAGA